MSAQMEELRKKCGGEKEREREEEWLLPLSYSNEAEHICLSQMTNKRKDVTVL